MNNLVYEFLGFHLVHIVYDFEQDEKVTQIRLGLKSINYDKGKNVLTLFPYIQIDGERNKNNSFEYVAGFVINDEEIRAAFIKEENETIEAFLPIFYASLFPFIRENIFSITKDTPNSIKLPTVDCRQFNLNKDLVLTPTE